MRKLLVLLVLAACGGSSPAPAQPDPEAEPDPEQEVSPYQCFSNEMLAIDECVKGTVEECQAAAEESEAAPDCFVPTEVWCYDYAYSDGSGQDCFTSSDACANMRDMSVDGADVTLAEDCRAM